MKFNKNTNQIIALFATALSLILALFTIVFDANRFDTNNIYFLVLISLGTGIIMFAYVLLIVKRINPKQYIYISFADADKDLAKLIETKLEEQLNNKSKYRFEFLTPEKIPYGSNISDTVKEYLDRSNIVIAIVSKDYIESSYRNKEFSEILSMNKKIIPVVIDSYESIEKLPKDVRNIKSLLLDNRENTEDLDFKLSCLAKDLVRQRMDN